MWVKQIQLINFRNYSNLLLDLKEGVAVFIGDNAQGKSNFLEAISIAISGKSFRNFHSRDLINCETKKEQFLSQIKIDLNKGSKQNIVSHKIETRIFEKRIEHILDHKKISKTSLVRNFGVVYFSPESLSAIKQGPSERRDLLDDIVTALEPTLHGLIADYAKILRTKNKVLRDILNEKIGHQEGLRILESLQENFIALGAELAFQRINTARQILPLIQRVIHKVFNSEIVEISVDYMISEESAIAWEKNQVYDSFSRRLKDLWRAELASGQSLVGPHKNDVKFLLNGRDSRFYCSQGQQRAIALAFKIAQIEAMKLTFGENPILVLDDVLSELDFQKQKNLVLFLQEISAQIFLSTTDLDHVGLLKRTDLYVYNVKNGNISKQG